MSVRLRIVIDARIEPGAAGGVEQWIVGLANSFSELKDGPEEYWFMTFQDSVEWLTPYLNGPCRLLSAARTPYIARTLQRALRVSRRSARTWWERVPAMRARPSQTRRLDRRLVPQAPGVLEHFEPDIVHFPTQSGFRTTVPSVYQPWDLQHLHLPEFFTPAQNEWRESTYRALAEQAALVVVASRWVKQDLLEQYGLPEDKVVIINVPPPTAVYGDVTDASINEARQRLRLPDQFAYYPAQTFPHKNHIRLLEAVKTLADRGLPIHVVCSGLQNDRYPPIRQTAERLGVADRVHFIGFVSSADVQALYATASMLVFPSLYEGWGLPVVEAMRARLPIACSNVTSLPELVGDAAIQFDPTSSDRIAEAIQSVWTDPALRSRLALHGAARIGLLDWHSTALTMRAHYRSIAGLSVDSADARLLAARPVV